MVPTARTVNSSVFRKVVDKFAGATYTGGHLAPMPLAPSGNSTHEFLERSAAINVLADKKNDALDVFAMPARTRGKGLDVEGLGIVYLEASATGLPVVAGRSGGAPETVLDEVTGHVVDGRDVRQLTDTLAALLADPARARSMGEAGRTWMRDNWRWDQLAHRLAWLLSGEPALHRR